MVAMNITADEIEYLGLGYAGFPANRQRNKKTNMRRYRSAYGVGPEACRRVIMDLQSTDIADASVPDVEMRGFFIALFWMKVYSTENNTAGRFGVDEKTARKKAWAYAKAIFALREIKVK